MIDIRLFSRWFISRIRSKTLSQEVLQLKLVNLGNYLKRINYLGYDGKIGNPVKEISTVYSSSLMGWYYLYLLTSNQSFLDNSHFCLERILNSQTKNGCWLFPYAFRKNPPDHPYACENFMTLRSLFFAYDNFDQSPNVKNAIERSIEFLRNQIGYKGGIFWYSRTDKIEVPNISSMAANAFSRASRIFHDSELLKQSREFADYCVKEQSGDGAYPYFANDRMIYIPYHALEMWELVEANEILNDKKIYASIERAKLFLIRYLSRFKYLSAIPSNSIRRKIIFKTPIWSAKAFLYTGEFDRALEHFYRGLMMFEDPAGDHYFYYLNDIGPRKISCKFPLFTSQFIRYNAFALEIGSSILKEWSN